MNLSELINEKAKELNGGLWRSLGSPVLTGSPNNEDIIRMALTSVAIKALKFAQLKVINANIQPSRVDIDDTRHVQELVAFSINDLINELKEGK